MRKLIILGAMAVIVATTVIWSIVMSAKPKAVADVQAAETSASVSPHEIMIKQGNILPVEYWAHPF